MKTKLNRFLRTVSLLVVLSVVAVVIAQTSTGTSGKADAASGPQSVKPGVNARPFIEKTAKEAEPAGREAETPGQPGRAVPRGATWEPFRQRQDKNGDGKVSGDEFAGPQGAFVRFDANGDGAVAREEFERQMRLPRAEAAANGEGCCGND